MSKGEYKYVIVGGGLAGASAIGGIRKEDKEGSILLIGKENHLPYNRPLLSKDLWFGKKEEEEMFINSEGYYKENNVDLTLNYQGVELIEDSVANETTGRSRVGALSPTETGLEKRGRGDIYQW